MEKKNLLLMLKETNTDTDIKGKKTHQTHQHSENNAVSRRLNKFRREKAALMSILPHGPKFHCVRNTDKRRLSTKMNSGLRVDTERFTARFCNNKAENEAQEDYSHSRDLH